MIREQYISVPDTGHGNPATFWSIVNQVPELMPIILKKSGWLASQAHSIMSTNAEVAANYTQSSEDKRTSFAARVFSKLMFEEFINGVESIKYSKQFIRTWIVVQEHALLGASMDKINRKGIGEVNLIVPDVFPKISGEAAIRQVGDHKKNNGSIESTFTVWNQEAYDYLIDLGFEVKLVAPFIIDGFNKIDNKEGSLVEKPQIVVKSGGSGIPPEWITKIKQELSWIDASYEIHLPNGHYDNELFVKAKDGKQEVLQRFYNCLSNDTQIIISPPSEITMVAADLRNRSGSNVILLSLPPRGQHELKNLEWAYQAGLCPGVLNIFPGQKSLSGIPLIELSDIATYISQTSGVADMNLGKVKVNAVLGIKD